MRHVRGRVLFVPPGLAAGARVRPSLAVAAGVGVFVVLALAGCSSQTAWIGGGTEQPDAIDRVRGLDLQPRFTKAGETANTGGAGADRPQLYYGTAGPEASAPPGRGEAAGGAGANTSGEGVDLNFENAPVTALAKVILGDVLGVGYTVDPRVQGTVTLSSGRPVPRSQLLFVLENALRAGNAVLVRDAGGYRILPVDDAVGNGGVDRGGRMEPGYGLTVMPLRHVSAQNVNKLLDGFSARPGAIRADPSGNLILIVGTGVERRTAVETILSFDQDWMRGQSVGIIPVRNTTPEPVVAELEKILDSGEAGLSASLVKLMPISRSNAILVVAKKPELLRQASTWISRLDGSATANTGVKVYRVRYGDARQIAKLLSELFTGGGAGVDSAANQLAPGSGAATTTDRLTGGTASMASSAMGAHSGSGGSGSSSGAGGFGSGAGQSPFGALGGAG
ncbi:secretin N-terminal domain-containing protein, partial [Methylocella sp.]|uniref:secretin N-terminal domain-containing protein n=1 Tax=Methylocella sp. TaxID=1978226 RepID=UPI003784B623